MRYLLSLALLGGVALAQTSAPTTTPAPKAPAQAAPAADPKTVVARIGTEEVTLGDFEQQYRLFVGRVVNQQGVPLTDDVLPYFNEYRGEILKQIVRQRGILQLARTAGIKEDAAKVDEAVAGTRKEFENDAEFAEALTQAGYSNAAFYRKAVSENLMTQAYITGLRDRFKFNDAVISGYYQANKADFQREAQACVKHILVKDDAAAKTVRDRLAKSEDFAAIAKEVSMDPGSKDQGGDLGCFGAGVTVPEFDKASFQGPLNQVQQVKTQYGTHLLVVSKRTPGGLAPLAEVQDAIRKTLADEAAQKYVTSQLDRIKTEVFADRVAAAPPAQK